MYELLQVRPVKLGKREVGDYISHINTYRT